MQKTKIEWCDYTINPIKGLCKNGCWYCYAAKMYKRFKWDEHLSADFSVFTDVAKLKKPSTIFIGSTNDIFGSWIPYHWIIGILQYCAQFNQHTYIFLTKNPSRYNEFIKHIPDNCWLGATITGERFSIMDTFYLLEFIRDKSIPNLKFISYEPMLACGYPEREMVERMLPYLGWLIIGGLSGHKYQPELLHPSVVELLRMALGRGIPVFIKDNMRYPVRVKEYPCASII